MSTIHAAVFRFYPTFVASLLLVQRALAFEYAPVDQPGVSAPRRTQTAQASEPAPERFDVIADEFAIPGVRFHVEVAPREPVREIHAYLPGVSGRRVRLALDPASGRYLGDLPVPERLDREQLTVRIVARDRARHRLQQDVHVPVLPDEECCDDEETCGLIPLRAPARELGLRADL